MESILDFLKKHTNKQGIPDIPENDWKELNSNYSKDEIRIGLAEFISVNKPPFPFREISEETVRNKFISLTQENIHSFINYPNKEDVVEKYSDYKYPYKQYGHGLIEFGHYYNDISNYFQQHNRMSCPSYGFASPLDIWNNKELLEKMNWIFWRMGTTTINETNIRGSFRLGAYIATQFKPHVAKVIYDYCKANKVLDFSMGWGDRLAGFYTSKHAKEYYGCDPNPNTFEVYKQQCIYYEKCLGCDNPEIEEYDDIFICRGVKKVVIFNLPAEDIDWKKYCSHIDCIFTSPPYFSTEIYNKGGDKEKNQSWSRYPEYENWRNKFLFPVLKDTFSLLNNNGIMAINIMDPTVNRIRHHTCDEMVEYITKDLNGIFFGQLGMRIKQRPKTLSKEELKKYLSTNFIENVWCFGLSQSKFKFQNGHGSLESILL